MRLESSARAYGWLALIFGAVVALCFVSGYLMNQPIPGAAPTTQTATQQHRAATHKGQHGSIAAATTPTANTLPGERPGDALILSGWIWAIPAVICWRAWRKRARQIQSLDYQARAIAKATT